MLAELIVGLSLAQAGSDDCIFREASWCVTSPFSIDETRSRYGVSTKLVLTNNVLGDGYVQVRASAGCKDSFAAGNDEKIVAQRAEVGQPDRNRAWRMQLGPQCDLFIFARGRGASLGPVTELVASSIRFCRDEACGGSAAVGLID